MSIKHIGVISAGALLAASAVFGSAATFVSADTATTTAYLALSSYSGSPGSSVNAVGTNFNSTEPVSVGFGGATTTATTDASGNFTLSLTVPSLPVGPATITALGQTSGRVATNSYYVQQASTSTATSTSTTTPSTPTDTAPLMVTGIDAVKGSATADGTFAGGWEWVLHIQVPDAETHFAMKFGNFVNSINSSSTIPAMNNIRIFSMQSSNASTTASAFVESGNGYSADMMLNGDMSTTTSGRQIDVHVQVAVPTGTPTGTYSTTFGAMSTTTPF